MTDTVSTAAPATAAATPPPPAAPAIPSPSGADDLAAAVASHQAQINALTPAGRTDVKPEVALLETRETAPPPAAETATDKPAEAAAPAQDAAAKPAEQAEDTSDKVADSIARYLQQERAAREDRRRAKEEREAIAKERAQIEQERAVRAKEQDLRDLAKRDPIAATRALLGDETLRGDFVVNLLNQLSAEESGTAPQMSDAQREAAIIEKAKAAIKAEQEAEQAKVKAEAERQRQAQAETNQRGKEAFFTGLAAQFKADKDKYPFLAAEPVDVPVIDRWLAEQFNQTGRIASPAEIFQHFEGIQEARAQRLAGVVAKKAGQPAPAAPAAAKPGPAAAPVSRAVDTRGATPPPPKHQVAYKNEREAIAARLDALDRR